MENLWRLLEKPDAMIVVVPIVAIVAGTIIGIVQMVHKHRERMAMIEHGMNPDHPKGGEGDRRKP